jgi:hypothetical protein
MDLSIHPIRESSCFPFWLGAPFLLDNKMSKDPAVLFYTSDFMTGSFLMTYEERGQYITLLCLQHQKGHLTKEEINTVTKSEQVIEKFELAEDGKYHNKRMHEESLKRKNYSESRKRNVASRYKKKRKSKATYVEHMENENEDIKVLKKKKKKDNIIVCREGNLCDEGVYQLFNDYLEMRRERKKYPTQRAVDLVIKKLNRYGLQEAKQMLTNSIISGWTDVYPLKEKSKSVCEKCGGKGFIIQKGTHGTTEIKCSCRF